MRNQSKGALHQRARLATSLGARDPRTRRNAAAFLQQRSTIEQGIGYDTQGRQRVIVDPRSPFGFTRAGELTLNVGDGVLVEPGSPYSLKLDRTAETAMRKDVAALRQSTARRAKELEDENAALRADLTTLQATVTALQATAAAIDSRVEALELLP